MSLTLSHTVRVSPPAAIQVRLVGVPQPRAAAKPQQKPEPVRTQDSAAPKEPPPEVKNLPPSEAKTKLLAEQKPVEKDKPNPIEAQKRPPVLDKTPREKKVVKNDLTAKVVKNPEDFLAALDFVDKLDQAVPSPTRPAPAPADKKPAGDGPQLQLNLSEQGAVDAIRAKINENWTVTSDDVRGLSLSVYLSLSADGNITKMQIGRGSGNPAFDRSLLRAVAKSVPLPIPADKYEKLRELELNFEAPQ